MADIVAVTSRTRSSAEAFARFAEGLGVTDHSVHDDIADLVADDRVDANWVLTPNDARLVVIESICEELNSNRDS